MSAESTNAVQGAIRLNYGCGETRKPGYIGIDCRPCPGADHVLQAWDTSPFEPDSVDEVYSRHMLEHLDPADARRALVAWWHVLKPGGRLHIIVPDLEFHARQLLREATSWSADSAENLAHAMAGFYGWRDANRGGSIEDAHRWGYTADTLSRLLVELRYDSVEQITTGPDSEPWHLNVCAVKPAG